MQSHGDDFCLCYWGCETPANKAAYVVFAVLACIGLPLQIIAGVRAYPCKQNYDACIAKQGSIDDCHNAYEECMKPGVTVLYIIGALALVGAGMVLCYFCCCARPPLAPQVPQVALTQQVTPYSVPVATSLPFSAGPSAPYSYMGPSYPQASYLQASYLQGGPTQAYAPQYQAVVLPKPPGVQGQYYGPGGLGGPGQYYGPGGQSQV